MDGQYTDSKGSVPAYGTVETSILLGWTCSDLGEILVTAREQPSLASAVFELQIKPKMS